MRFLRTSEDRFANLPGYPFAAHYLNVLDGEGGSLRMHYVDEGPADAPVVLLLHGEPSWSYLYRKMIPLIAQAGLRAVAPDLIGFGKSDKPSERSDYTYAVHVAWVWSCVEQLDLQAITLVCQDWGSLIGLRLVAEHPERFARVVVANGGMPTGDQQLPEAFFAWQRFSQEVDVLPVGGIVARGCAEELAAEVVAAYEAPFPDESYKAGARQFPSLVPSRPDDPAAEANRAAWAVLMKWEKPFLTAFSDQDPITRGGEKLLQKLIPGTRGQPHTTISGGGHFLQEDKGEELARVVVDFVKASG
ncbi:MAG TPA: haloalkane dehalogenase [Polyangiaceae bacterium]|nr:haloalkane dehalogenase [Polyangiaceae bacterium]